MNNNHYIYAWKYSDHINLGVPFYIGQGKYAKGILEKTKCVRAYSTHYRVSNSKNRILALCQLKANKLKLEGTPHIVEILEHNLTKSEANALEIELIRKYGRKINNTGILYNVSEGGDINPMDDLNVRSIHANSLTKIDRIKQREHITRIMNDPIMKKNISNSILQLMNDSEYKAHWLKIINTPENIENIRQIQSEVRGIKLEYDGIIYRSKKELARYLKISPQLLNFRLRNNIPLNTLAYKGNHFNKNKGKAISRFINTSDSRCSKCGEIKHKSLFSKNNRSSTGVRSMCKKCELEKRKNKIKN